MSRGKLHEILQLVEIDATAAAIEKCMTDEELRQRIRAAASNRSTHFSFENMVSNTILVYNTKYEDVS